MNDLVQLQLRRLTQENNNKLISKSDTFCVIYVYKIL